MTTHDRLFLPARQRERTQRVSAFLVRLRGYPGKLLLHARALAGRAGDFCSFPFLQAEIQRRLLPTIKALVFIGWHISSLPALQWRG